MTIVARLTALERATTPVAPRCPDPFHRHLDYREVIRPLCPAEITLPPAPRCPKCVGELFSSMHVQIIALDYTDAVAGIVRSPAIQENP